MKESKVLLNGFSALMYLGWSLEIMSRPVNSVGTAISSVWRRSISWVTGLVGSIVGHRAPTFR